MLTKERKSGDKGHMPRQKKEDSHDVQQVTTITGRGWR